MFFDSARTEVQWTALKKNNYSEYLTDQEQNGSGEMCNHSGCPRVGNTQDQQASFLRHQCQEKRPAATTQGLRAVLYTVPGLAGDATACQDNCGTSDEHKEQPPGKQFFQGVLIAASKAAQLCL